LQHDGIRPDQGPLADFQALRGDDLGARSQLSAIANDNENARSRFAVARGAADDDMGMNQHIVANVRPLINDHSAAVVLETDALADFDGVGQIAAGEEVVEPLEPPGQGFQPVQPAPAGDSVNVLGIEHDGEGIALTPEAREYS